MIRSEEITNFAKTNFLKMVEVPSGTLAPRVISTVDSRTHPGDEVHESGQPCVRLIPHIISPRKTFVSY